MADVNTSVGTTLYADTRQFSAGMTQASQSLTNFGNNVNMSATKMAALAGAVGGLASTLGMSFIQMAKSSASFAFNTVADFEQTRIGFEGILQSGEKAKSFLDELQAFAATTPFEFTQLATASKQLLAVGFAAGDVIPMMTKLGDTAANLGLGTDALQMTIRAIGQIRGAGKAMTQDLYQITNALPGFNPFKAIGDDIGKTQAEVRKMIEQGLIPADQAINAILTGMGNMPGAAGAMGRQVNTIKGQLSNLKDAIQINLISAFNNTKPAVNALKGIVAGLGPAMKMTFTFIGGVLKPLGPLFSMVGSAVKTLFMAIKPLAAVVGGALLVGFTLITEALKLIAKPFNALMKFMQNNIELVQGVAAGLAILSAAYLYNANIVKINTFFTKVWTAVTKAAAAAALFFKNGIVALNLAMTANPIIAVIAALVALAAGFVYAWKHSESFRKIATEAINWVAKTVGEAVAFVLETLGSWLTGLSEILDANTTFGDAIRAVYDFIYKAILTWVEGVVTLFGYFLEGLKFVSDQNNIVGKIIAGVFNFIWETIGTVVAGALDLFGMLMNGISALVDPTNIVGKVISGIFDFIYRTIFKTVGNILYALGFLLGKIAAWAEDNEGIVNAFIKIWTFVPKAILSIVSVVLSAVGKMFIAIGEWFNKGIQKVKEWMTSIADAISYVPKMDWIANGIRKAADSLSSFGTKFQTSMTAVGNGFIAAADGVSNFKEKLVDMTEAKVLIAATKESGKVLRSWSETAKALSALTPGKDFLDLIASATAKAGEFAKNIGTWVKSIKDMKVGSIALDLINKGAEVGTKFADAIQKGIEKAKELNLGTMLINGMQTALQKSGSFLSSMAATIQAYTGKDFVEKAGEDLSGLFDKIKSALGFGGVDEMVKDAKEAVEKAKETTDTGAGKIIKDQAAVMEKIRDALKKGLDTMAGVIDDLKKAATDMANGLKDAIVGFAGLKGVELPDGFIPQAKSLIRNMEMRLQKSQEFATQIATLQAQGLNAKALQDIIEMGPIKGAQVAASILSGGIEAVQRVSKLTEGISMVGAKIGEFGSDLVYGKAIGAAEKLLAQQATAGQNVQFMGGQVIVENGAINLAVNIKGADDDQEVIALVTDAVQNQFNELAKKLSVVR